MVQNIKFMKRSYMGSHVQIIKLQFLQLQLLTYNIDESEKRRSYC